MRRRHSNLPQALFLFLVLCALSIRAQNINISLVSQREPNISSSISYGDVWAEDDIACLGIWLGYNTSNGVGIYAVDRWETSNVI